MNINIGNISPPGKIRKRVPNALIFLILLFSSILTTSALCQAKPERCILVFGAHADDVEPMAGGTFAKYLAEGYRGIYVCVINNFAGCGIESVGGGTTPPPEAKRPLFTVSSSTLDYPADALETMQIRSEEARTAAAVFHAEPVFLDFHEGFIWFGRSRANIGSYEYWQYSPPGRQAVSLAEEEEGNIDFLVELLRKYSPEIVITHTLGGDKHDHGNSAYIMYLAFKRAIEKGIPVGKLWMKPKGWLLDESGKPGKRGKPDVNIDVTDYVGVKYEALNKHVSQKGTIRKPKLPDENTERFITVIDNTLRARPGVRGGQNGKTVAGIADQVHFSVIDNTSVTFDWTGTAEAIATGTKPGKLNKVIKARPASFLPVISPWKSDPGPYREARLTGLKMNTTYYYKIGDNQVEEFKTPPLPGSAGFRIVLTTDMHEGSAETLSMFSQIAGLKPDIVLTSGDITGAGPDGQKNVAERFHDAMAWSQNAAWIPAWGNHDWEYDTIDDLRTYKGRFDIPHPGKISGSPAISCCGEDWGWFDYGNTRIISLPEPWESSVRSEWLTQVAPVFEEAQKNPQIKFIITFGHRSAYTSTNRRSPGEQGLATMLNKLHSDYPKYKLDLSGHNHQYERYLFPGNMTYVVNVSTGSYYHEGWQTPEKPEYCVLRAIHYGLLVLDVSENSIAGRLECSHGSTQSGPDYLPLEEPVCSSPGAVIDSFKINADQ